MSLRYVVSAFLLFTAAAGWLSPPAAAVFGRARTLPPACVLLGAAVLLAGWLHRHEREKP